MIKGILSFFKCCKSRPKPLQDEGEDDIKIINNSEINKILREYDIKESNFYSIEEDKIKRTEKSYIKYKTSKNNNDSIITIESGNKIAVDVNVNRFKNEKFENFNSYQKVLEDNRSFEVAKLKYDNNSNSILYNKSNSHISSASELIEKDFNKI